MMMILVLFVLPVLAALPFILLEMIEWRWDRA